MRSLLAALTLCLLCGSVVAQDSCYSGSWVGTYDIDSAGVYRVVDPAINSDEYTTNHDPLYWRVKLIDGVTPEEWHRHSIHAYTDWNGPDTTWERIPGRWRVRVDTIPPEIPQWMRDRYGADCPLDSVAITVCGHRDVIKPIIKTTYTPLQPVFLSEEEMLRLQWIISKPRYTSYGRKIPWPSTMRKLSDECARTVGKP